MTEATEKADENKLDLSKLQKPPLEIVVGDKTIKMTYGLEMDIRRQFPDPATTLQLAMGDPYTQDYIVRRLLTDTKKMVMEEKELIDFDEIDISTEDVERLLMWAVEHALYFFAKRTEGVANLGERFQLVLPKASNSGSEALASTTPSAGPSALSKDR